MTRLLGVRREDGPTVWLAFATLLTIVAAHSVLETARDALFLAHLPPRLLPWAYFGIAIVAFVATGIVAGRSPRGLLAALLVLGAAGTAALWWIVATPDVETLMALYVWTGTLASAVVAQFWVELGGRMNVGLAKRTYAVVAAGGMLGAMLGSLLAAAILQGGSGPRTLVLVAAALFVVACVPALGTAAAARPPAPPSPDEDERPGLAAVFRDPYLARLLVVAIIAPVAAMAVDYAFKSLVSREVARADLGSFFARYNAIVNAAALAVQVALAPRLLQRVGVVRVLCILPGALGLAAAGLAATATLPAALVLRGIDGTLRHSVHRAATEILFLPLSARTRTALRGLAESIGQRGGQVLGSVLILGAIGAGAGPRELAVGVAVLCGVWLLAYLRLREHYVDRFRAQLRTLGATTDAEIPELDVHAVETLVTSLGATNDAEVIAALDLLEIYGRARLVSPLILYHPSPAVVLRAIAFFDGVERPDLRELRHRLLDHREPTVRAATLRRLGADERDRTLVRRSLRNDPSPLVRGTALVLWTGIESTPAGDVDEAVADLVASDEPAWRLAVAETLGELPGPLRLPVARELLRGATPAIRRHVARALAADPDVARVPLLIELVARPESRAAARTGLRALGERALEPLAAALADEATPPAIRRHLPRTIGPFGSARAAAILVEQLAREGDGCVIFKILRGLGRMRANDPVLPIDQATLTAVAERNLQRTVELLAFEVAHALGAGSTERASEDLLGRLLVEKRERALERVFRVLQILETREDFAIIFQALRADVPALRESGRELIGHALRGDLRDALLAVTEAAPAGERLEAASRALAVPVADAVLATMRAAREEATLVDVAASLVPVLERLCADPSASLASLARRRYARPSLLERRSRVAS
jgi:ATP/ADP translocase/HEAT repeat protein